MTVLQFLIAISPVLLGLIAVLLLATALLQPSRGVRSRANNREGFNSR